MNRRGALICLCGIGLTSITRGAIAKTNLSSLPIKQNETAMRAAIAMAVQNASYPFSAVITNAKSGTILAKGVNQTSQNPVLHGEMACINNYVSQQGNKNWGDCILYTTGEPCPMSMSALVWAGIGGVVYGSSAATIKKSGQSFTSTSSRSFNFLTLKLFILRCISFESF
ncbi:nucleoside deaminase [Polynucleobacter necessarius]|uniref:nucleoside deaminase n=1 Tax=Polynucleobacter necessarius TaxID=576610 RepID=UPI000E08EC01|nr:nucleoside deaminase [Polynucleobacter necessarius]